MPSVHRVHTINPVSPVRGISTSEQVAIWIDHKEAHIVQFHPDRIEESTIVASPPDHHKHPKGPAGAREHPEDNKRFFGEVTRSLAGTQQVLVVGPSSAKHEFLQYARKHDPAFDKKIVGLETVDHPTRGQLVAHAKEYFLRSDRVRQATV